MDERFKHLATDPRFKPLRKSTKKKDEKEPAIDERFQAIHTDERFQTNVDRDKRESESESELSSSSDESDDSDIDDGEQEIDAVDLEHLPYDWQPLDHDADTADETSKRLAIQNLDWDHLNVQDIYTLINSIRPPVNVRIYVSEFGKERLAKEEKDGPLELIDLPVIDEDEQECKDLEEKMRALDERNRGNKSYKINEYEDADDALDSKNDEVRERIRRYQLSKMKYYYAIAEFDSAETAEVVYKELDGMEYEGSSLELDLRFVPDDVEFDPVDMKSECDKLPNLKPYEAPQFINSALQQTTVKFTWDETDAERQKKLHRAYTQEELEKDDLENFFASDTESESEGVSQKYKDLLASLDEDKKKDDDDIECEFKSDTSSEIDRYSEQREEENAEQSAELELITSGGEVITDKNFEFDPDDERFKAVYESATYNIDRSHPKFKRTKAFDQIAEKKRAKKRKTA